MRCLTKSKSNQCFTCRSNIPQESIQINERLVRVLQRLNPAYNKDEDAYELPSEVAEKQLQQQVTQKVRVIIEPRKKRKQSETPHPKKTVVVIETYKK